MRNYRYIYTYTHTYVCCYNFLYVCMYVCMCMYMYICIRQFPRSTTLPSLVEQPAVTPLFDAKATWESATDLHKTSLGLHRSDRAPRSPGGRIDICQRSHHRSDRTHQMRKFPRARIKSPRPDHLAERRRATE